MPLLQEIKETRRFLDPDRGFHIRHLCEALAIRRSDLAQATHRTPQALHRYFERGASYISVKTGEVRQVLNELLVILDLLGDLVSDPEKIRFWMRLPNPGFGNASPIDLVREGRSAEVIETIRALVTGDHAR